MRRRVVPLAAIISLMLIGLIGIKAGLGAPSAGTVYTPAQLAVLRQQNPRAWNGRTVLVRGWLVHTGPSCPTPVRCTYPGWMINRNPCPHSSRCAYASVDMIGTIIQHVGWDFKSELVVPASHAAQPFPTVNQIVLNIFGGLPFVDEHVHDGGSIYRIRLLPQAICKGPTVIVPLGRFVCQPDAIRV